MTASSAAYGLRPRDKVEEFLLDLWMDHIIGMRVHMARMYYGENIGRSQLDWFRFRARHAEWRLAGPIGRLP